MPKKNIKSRLSGNDIGVLHYNCRYARMTKIAMDDDAYVEASLETGDKLEKLAKMITGAVSAAIQIAGVTADVQQRVDNAMADIRALLDAGAKLVVKGGLWSELEVNPCEEDKRLSPLAFANFEAILGISIHAEGDIGAVAAKLVGHWTISLASGSVACDCGKEHKMVEEVISSRFKPEPGEGLLTMATPKLSAKARAIAASTHSEREEDG